MNHSLVASIPVLCVIALGAAEANQDAIKEKLDKAKLIYAEEVDAFKIDVKKWFSDRDTDARKSGTDVSIAKKVEQLKAEQKEFDETGLLPPNTLMVLLQKSTTMRGAMESAYRGASKEYRKTKQDDAATDIEKQLDTFLRSPIGVTPEERAKKLILGKWIQTGNNHLLVFSPNGILTDQDGMAISKGKWSVAKDGTVSYLMDNKWAGKIRIGKEKAIQGESRSPQGAAGPRFEAARAEQQ